MSNIVLHDILHCAVVADCIRVQNPLKTTEVCHHAHANQGRKPCQAILYAN